MSAKSTTSKFIKATPKPLTVKVPTGYSLSKGDIEKLFRELIQKEFARLGIHLEDPQDISNDGTKDDKPEEDDPMDIDLVRLENAKDLLAMEGKVEGAVTQILADTCANLSWIPKMLADELEMDVDTTKIHRVNGVSGEEKSLGMVKDCLIELQTGCTIKEDLAVVNYSHREIGLSRPCLRRYNYDVHESREHIALTCDGKNFFIPIVPDQNRSGKQE